MFCGIRKKYDAYCRKYLEVHGRVVDFITPSIEGATFYFSGRFADYGDVGRGGGDRIRSPPTQTWTAMN
jgi:hypothetical protein